LRPRFVERHTRDVGIYDPRSDSMTPSELARTMVRRNLRLFAAIGLTTGAIGAYVLAGRILTQSTPALVLGLMLACALLFSIPPLALSFRSSPPQAASLEAQIESSRRTGNPIRALSTAFLAAVFLGGIVFAAVVATLMPL